MRRFPGAAAPDSIPLLLPGAHDRPEHGACFMEYASVLAGERFTDHPRCTHPVLAAACRAVNDYVSDARRQQLARYVPEVIGLRSNDPRVTAALVLTCLQAVDPYCDGVSISPARANAENRLVQGGRGRWARAMLRVTEPDNRTLGARLAGETVRYLAAVGGDAVLHRLLVDLLSTYQTIVGPTTTADGQVIRSARGRQIGVQR